MENLFFKKIQNGGYVITYRPTTNLQLGQIENIEGENQMLVCKFANEFSEISGDKTRGVSKDISVYVGYRSIDETKMRVAAMAAIKGTANYKLPTPIPAVAGYRRDSEYYEKEHFAMPIAEYDEFIDKAIGGFATHIANMPVSVVYGHNNASIDIVRKYGVFLYPQSRSNNARELCNKLKATVGTDDSYVEQLNKMMVDYDDNIERIFDIPQIVAALYGALGELRGDAKEEDVNETKTQIAEVVKFILAVKLENNPNLSTASNIRSVRMGELQKEVAAEMKLNIDAAAAKKANGRLDDFAKSHHKTDVFLGNYNTHITTKRKYNKQLQTFTDIADNARSVLRSVNSTTEDKKGAKIALANSINNRRVLIVDDNINSGDLYKQVADIINNELFGDIPVDFFFLMSRQTYASNKIAEDYNTLLNKIRKFYTSDDQTLTITNVAADQVEAAQQEAIRQITILQPNWQEPQIEISQENNGVTFTKQH